MREQEDPFWFCEFSGCEGVSENCRKTCPYGKESSCPPLTSEPKAEYIEICNNCKKDCTKREYILKGYPLKGV